MQGGGFRPAIAGGDAHEQIVGIDAGIFDKNIEIAVIVEYAGIDELIFRLQLPAAPIFLPQLRIRKGALRIFVERFQVGMRGQGIQVIV